MFVSSPSGCGRTLRLAMAVGMAAGGIAGCSGDDDAARSVNPEIADLTGGACQVEVAFPPDEGQSHVPSCTAVSYQSKPPSSGAHYGTWPVFRVYDKPVPWGFLMHGLEHGAVVIAHNCAGDCSADLAEIRALYAEASTRPACPRPPLIVTPDPTLDVPFAASAWGATLRARCFDKQRFAAFVQRRANRGPEFFPNDCGASDLETAGWCPTAPP